MVFRRSYSKRPSQCPTDYNTWTTASKPYVVSNRLQWMPDFEGDVMGSPCLVSTCIVNTGFCPRNIGPMVLDYAYR